MLLVGIALCVHTRGKNEDKRPPRLGLGYDDSSNPGRKRPGLFHFNPSGFKGTSKNQQLYQLCNLCIKNSLRERQ